MEFRRKFIQKHIPHIHFFLNQQTPYKSLFLIRSFKMYFHTFYAKRRGKLIVSTHAYRIVPSTSTYVHHVAQQKSLLIDVKLKTRRDHAHLR